MDDAGPWLVMTTPTGAVAARAPLVKRITTAGSAPDADVQVAHAPRHWLTIHREADGGGVSVKVLATGARHALAPGEQVAIDGTTIELAQDSELEAVAARLAAADTPADALRVIVDAAIAAAGADLGAIVLAEGGAWS